MLAAMQGRTGVCAKLLEVGVNPNVIDSVNAIINSSVLSHLFRLLLLAITSVRWLFSELLNRIEYIAICIMILLVC